MRLTLIALAFCAVKLAAQDVPIEGIVVESGTDIPIAGAKVVLRYLQSPTPLDTVTTEAPGTFKLTVHEPGSYALEADAPGFENLVFRGDGNGITVPEAEFEAGADHPARRFTVRLSRTGLLVGHVQDSDTKQPMNLVTVRALRYWWLKGRRQLTEERVAFTDEKGIYRLESLPVGDYVLEFQQRARGDSGYPVVLWPGVTAESASPIAVRGGTESNAGTFSYSKAIPGRIQGNAGSNCDHDQGYQINLQQRAGGALLKRQFEPVGCGQPFSIADLSPGSYRLLLIGLGHDLRAMNDNSGTHFFDTKDVDISEGADLDLQLRLTDAAAITGRVICDCDKQQGLRIIFQPAEENGIVSDIDVRDDGTFSGQIGVVGTARVQFQNLRPGLYVKRFVYAGSEAGHLVEVRPDSSVTAEITLGEGPAAVTGTAAADNSHIVIAHWPVPVFDGEAEFESTQVDKDGHFRIAAIVPGTYRIAKVNVMDWQHKDEPGAVEQWLDSGQELTLAEKETRNVMFPEK